MPQEIDEIARQFISGENDYLVLNTKHFHLTIALDEHRPVSEPQDRVMVHISCMDNNGNNHDISKKSLKRLEQALTIDIGGGIVRKHTSIDQTSCVETSVELNANPKTVDRQELYDKVKQGFERASVIYEKHLKEKPDRQRTKLEEAMAGFDGQTLTPELRQQIADVLVKKIFSPEKTK